MGNGKETLPATNVEQTHRKLKGRHLQMIAIGGTIGTGLFLKSGDMIASSGPLGALVAYFIAGISVFCVVMSLGEMATLFPVSGSFNAYAERFVDPALGFTAGWTYWFQWALTLPIELQACAKFLSLWFNGESLPAVPTWVWYLSICAILLALNLFSVSGFGEAEYWLSLIKILAILVFILTGIIVIFRDNLGFSAYSIGGPFSTGGAIGIAGSMVSACFAFGGTELVGITAGEAGNPRKNVPKAINSTFWRILIFYIVSIFLIGLIVPSTIFQQLIADDASELAKSPFVLAFSLARVPAAADIMNFIGLSAVFSAGNSSIYASSRTMMALCEAGQGPKFLSKTTKNGVPLASILITCAFGMISLVGSFIGDGIVFNWLVNMIGLTIIGTWTFISISHIFFRRAYLAQGYKLEDLPYKSPLGIAGDYFAIFINLIVIFLSYFGGIIAGDEFKIADFIANYISLVPYPVLYYGYKFYVGTSVVKPNEADLQTGHVSLHDIPEDVNKPPKTFFKKLISFIA